MKTNTALKCRSLKNVLDTLDILSPVTVLGDYKKERIKKALNSVVYVKGRANVLIKELFSPLNSAAVVIRRRDGSYLDPCDFGSYLRRNNPKRN